ncbi:tetratricopeptide repeat protein [Trichococcus sp.]|uniref:tetratricopeptide repeat protein n=1 Tax=Trichococcus sp. TaxID=1985464 RepID=UPI003C7E5395
MRYLTLAGLLLLAGCGNAEQEAYNEAIQKGVDILSAEQYEKAEAYFEIALENQPDDEKATAYLAQTQIYREAKDFYDSKEYAEALEKAQQVVESENGLEGLIAKATAIIEEINAKEDHIDAELDKAKAAYDSGNMDEALPVIENLLNSEELSNAYFSELKAVGEQLLADIQNKQNELAMDEAAKAKVEEESLLQGSIDRNINAYNNLSLPLRMLLATTVVDERAMSPVLLGYTLAYNFDEEYLLLNSHSGAGVGHQWFIIRDDSNTITPIEGLVNMGTSGYRDVAVDSTPVSKADLYNRYMESKDSYDLALQNVFRLPEMTMIKYEELRSYSGQ